LKSRVVLRRAAELDVVAIEDWYDAQQDGLGVEFREALDELLTRIAANPLAYPEKYRGNRRAMMQRFPYVVWYRVEEEISVVLACVHGRRDPALTRARTRDGG
jgi:plasmid stabilization system protein ParE